MSWVNVWLRLALQSCDESFWMGLNVIEQHDSCGVFFFFLINGNVKQVGMDGDEKGSQDAKTTLLILRVLTLKF